MIKNLKPKESKKMNEKRKLRELIGIQIGLAILVAMTAWMIIM